MIFTLTDRHYNVLDAYETDDYLIGQYIGSILETLEINVLVKSLNAEHWTEGNYIMCQDKKGKKRWFTIYDCEDSHGGDAKSLFCYSGTIDIVAEDAAPISAPDPKPFKWYFDTIFYDTGIELGINEISDLTRKLEFTSENASNAEMLQYVLNGFDNAEASLDVEFDGATPTKLVLNVYKRIGNEEPQAILSDEDDSLTSLDRKGSISDLATCINPTGAEDENGNPITLVGKYYEERDEQGNILYYSPVDSPRVFSVVARQNFYVQLPGKANGEFDGYINRRYESQATTQDTLWQESLAQLKKIDHVAVTYEANGYIDCSIGDNVQIVSHEMKPPVMIAARTIEYKFNDDDPSRNVYKFGNYVELTSNLDELSKIVADLKQKLLIVTVVASAGTVFKNGTGETDLTAVTILGGKEVDTDGLFYSYVWSKYDKNGNFVGATSGKSITVYAQNIDEKETYIVTVENQGAKSIGQITVTNVNDGSEGAPGKSVETITEYYLATSANSGVTRSTTGWTTTFQPVTNEKKYLWSYKKITYKNPTDEEYTDPVIVGVYGDKGEQGPAGKGVSSIQEQYYLSTSNTTQTGGSWSNTPPAWQDGKYMWTRSVITYTDGTSVTTNPVCVTGAKGPTGATGNGIQSVDVEYYLSTSATALSGGSWSTTAPTWQDGKYMWSRTKTVYTNGTTTYSDPACITGAKGPQGPQGVPGPKGADGQTLYTWIKYADSPTSGMSDTPDGKKYIGLAYNKTSPTESSNYADYSWSLIQGPQGVQGPKGADGVTTYTWVKYADDDRGNGMSDSPNGKRYLGLAYNKTTPTESSNPSDYSWSPLYDNVKVGGRNLIRNSDFSQGRTYRWSGVTELVDGHANGFKGAVLERTGYEGTIRAFLYQGNYDEDIIFSPEENYTLSGWFYIDSSVPLDGDNNAIFVRKYKEGTDGNLIDFINVPINLNNYKYDTWYYFEKTGKYPVGYTGFEQIAFAMSKNGRVIISGWKLEKGNVATDWTPAPEDVQAAIDQAKRDAENAQSTADGKNTVFYQATAPSTAGRKVNDLWYDTDDGYKPYRFDGSNWVAAPFGNAAIANLDAGKITTGYLSAARIAAKSIDVSKLNVSTLSAITANLGNITAGNISGVNITGSTLTATGSNNASVTIDENGWYVKDETGNVKLCVTTKETDFAVRQPSAIQFFTLSGSRAGYVGMYENQDIMSLYSGTRLYITAPRLEMSANDFYISGEARFYTTTYTDPEPNVMKAIKVSGGIATDVLYANARSVNKDAIRTSGKIYVGGEGIEVVWPGGTPYIDFTRVSGADYNARIIIQSDSSLAFMFDNNSTIRHRFYANGTKSGGSIEIDSKNLGMSPIDSPQVLLETIEFDVPLTADGTKVLLDSRFAKAVNYRFAVFPNNGRVIEKGPDYFIIAGDGLADIRIVGERVGYAGVYFDDMTMEGVT